MKPTHFLAIFPTDITPISRERAAYLLRAGRSRQKNNVTRDAFHSYTIADGNLIISPQGRWGHGAIA